MEEIGLDIKNIADKEISPDPPWFNSKPRIIWTLSKHKKENTTPIVYKRLFCEVRDTFKGFKSLFTDGSKMDDAVAAAAVSNDYESSRRLPDGSSIFTAEMRAILAAFFIIKHTPGKNFIIFSDSRSCLQALEQMEPENPIVAHTQHILKLMKYKYKKDIIFCWIPSHIGIQGNERADLLAK
jgi:ribonuclease HI